MMEERVVEVQEGATLTCVLCFMSTRPEGVKLGGLYRVGDLVAHHFCLIMASGLAQNGEDDEGILGFLSNDIERELRRGQKLKCYLCKKTNATVGCCVKSCHKTFHLPCCLSSGGLSQFFGNFDSFCSEHRPKQRVPECYWKRDISSNKIKSSKPGPTKLVGQCGVCLDRMQLKPGGYSSLWTPCCKGWFHRKCIDAMADAAGCHFIKCPLCNNKEVFEKEMLRFGIYIPDRDARWETDENAFEDLYVRHSTCDTQVCLCPHGRDHNVEDTDFELILCELCGSQGVHVMCAGLDPVNLRWKCELCLGAIKHKHVKEIEKKIDKLGGTEKYWLMDQDSSDDEDKNENLQDFSDAEVFEKCFKGSDARIWSAITSICKIDLKKIDLERTNIANQEDVMIKRAVIHTTVKNEREVTESKDQEYIDAFNCEECNFDCDSDEGLKRHMKLHDPSREFACVECGLRFLKERHVSIHARIHTGEKPFRCDMCLNSFAESWSLKLHMSKHDPRRKFGCVFCTLRFKSRNALNTHVEKLHAAIKEEHPYEDETEKDVMEAEFDQPSTSSSGYFGVGKPTSAGRAWLESVKQETGRINCFDSDSQHSHDESLSRGKSISSRKSTSRERTSSPNIENVGWRKNKPKIKIYHPRSSKLKSSPKYLDHNYSSGPDEKNSKIFQRKLSKEFLESKDDLVKPFTLKIKKSSRSWLDERSVSSSDDDSDINVKRLRLEQYEDSNGTPDFLESNDVMKSDIREPSSQFKQRASIGSNVRTSLDEDDRIWCHKMKIDAEEGSIRTQNTDDDVSILSSVTQDKEFEGVINISESETGEENISQEVSESDDFSIKSDELPDPIDDLLADSASESDLGLTRRSIKHVPDHDYVRDGNSEDETCSESEDNIFH